MKANDVVTLTGKIAIRKFGEGSKSEHDAVYLDTPDGSYVLRQEGVNPFENTELKKMAGRNVTAEGTINSYLFFISHIQEDDDGHL